MSLSSSQLSKIYFDIIKKYIDERFILLQSELITDNINESTPNAGVTVGSSLLVNGDLTITGNSTFIESIETVIKDSNVLINGLYTTPSYTQSGIILIYEPTAVQDTCSQINANLTITTVGSATFSSNDIISISNTDSNNNVYEVDTHIGNILTVRGTSGTPNVESFTRKTLTTETVAGVITKVNISHTTTNAAGQPIYAAGNTTGLSYNPIGTDISSLQDAYDNGSTILYNTNGIYIRDNATPIVGNLLEITNSADNSDYFTVNTLGITTKAAIVDSLTINSHYNISSVLSDSVDNILTPGVASGLKVFRFNCESNDNAVAVRVENKNSAANAHSALILQTDRTGGTGAGGNQVIVFNTQGTVEWSMGKRITDNTFRWDYGANDYLIAGTNTKMYLDTSGNLNLTGALTCTTINTGLGATDVYLMNQNVRTTDNVEFLTVNINNGNTILSSSTDSTYLTEQTPGVTTGVKSFSFTSNTTDNAVILQTINVGAGATSHTTNQLLSLGNRTILFEKTGVNKWEIGAQSSTDTYRFNFGTGYDYLTNDSFTKMYLDTSGNLNLTGALTCTTIDTGLGATEVYLMNQNVRTTDTVQFERLAINDPFNVSAPGILQVSGTFGDSANYPNISFIEPANNRPSIQVSGFTSDTSFISFGSYYDSGVFRSSNTTYKSLLYSYTGGLQISTATGGSIGDTITWNNVGLFDNTGFTTTGLVCTTINTGLGATEVYLMNQNIRSSDNVEFLTININNGNTILSSSTDSIYLAEQTPAITTGAKSFIHRSTTTSGAVSLEVYNEGVGSSSHSNMLIRALNTGGNMTTQYFSSGYSVWVQGYQKSSDTFRWNFDGTGTDYLINDGNTKMYLDTSGNLNLIGSLTCTTINTGLGATEVYLMNQNVRTTDTVQFERLAINDPFNVSAPGILQVSGTFGDSANYPNISFIEPANNRPSIQVSGFTSDTSFISFGSYYDSGVFRSSNTTYKSLLYSYTGGLQILTATGGSIGDTITWNNVGLFDNTGFTTTGLVCTTINTGLGATDVYLMNQNVRTSDNVEFLTVNINNGNTILSSSTDSSYLAEQTPAVTTGEKSFVFTSHTTNAGVVIQTINIGVGATAHASYQLFGSGNRTILFEKSGTNKWEIGAQSSTDTFRFNFGTGYDYLTNDSFTKMYLDTSGNLNLTGALTCTTINTGLGATEVYLMNQNVRTSDNVEFLTVNINNGNTILSSSNDSSYLAEQTPAITTGSKLFTHKSVTTSGAVSLEVYNEGVGTSSHSNMLIRALNTGGNMTTQYFSSGYGVWVQGYQKSSDTFRWNFDGSGNDYLINDSNTKMYLDTSGNLNLIGSLTCTTINTGLGATEVYLMNQNIRTTDPVQFDKVASNNSIVGGSSYNLSAVGTLQIEGTAGTRQGVSITQPSNNHAVMHMRSFSSSINSLSFGAYDTGGVWTSSNAGGSILFDQVDGQMNFYAGTAAVGNAISLVNPMYFNAGGVRISTLYLDTPVNNDSATQILVMDGNQVKYRNYSSIMPYNQSLNTSDAPTFAGLIITNSLNVSSGYSNLYAENITNSAYDRKMVMDNYVGNVGRVMYAQRISGEYLLSGSQTYTTSAAWGDINGNWTNASGSNLIFNATVSSGHILTASPPGGYVWITACLSVVGTTNNTVNYEFTIDDNTSQLASNAIHSQVVTLSNTTTVVPITIKRMDFINNVSGSYIRVRNLTNTDSITIFRGNISIQSAD